MLSECYSPPRPASPAGSGMEAGQCHGVGIDGVGRGLSVGAPRGLGGDLAGVITTTHTHVITV
jgi:hypothetical protein